MKAILSKVFNFFTSPSRLYLVLLCVLVFVAVYEFFSMGLARRTFVFYTNDNGKIAVEDRMLKHYGSREEDIIRYTEETLQGPVSPKDLLPLFPLETKLKSLMLRGRTVYADFTESAALPLPDHIKRGGGGNVLDNFRTLHDSLLRNFSFVSEIWFFVEGNAISLENTREPEYNFDMEKDLPGKAVPEELPET